MKTLKEIIKTTIRETLNEGVTDIIYHFTSNTNVVQILHNNTFELTFSVGSGPDYKINKGRYYYLSTTRSKSSGYNQGDVRLKLDGKKLSDNNKFTPVDYWNYPKSESDWDNKRSYIQALKSLEQEDRIVSNKSTIHNAAKYILSIDLVLNRNTLPKIIYYAEKYNIPLYVYKSKEDLLLSKNPINYDEYRGEFNPEEIENYPISKNEIFSIASLIAYKNKNNYDIIVNNLIHTEEDLKKFNDVLETESYNNFKINSRNRNSIDIINDWFSFIRRLPDKRLRFLFNLMIKDMKSLGVKTLKEYIEAKRYYGLKPEKQFKSELLKGIYEIIDNYSENYGERFDYSIEIDEEYYYKMYDAPEFLEYMDKLIVKLKSIIKDIIYNKKNDIIEHYFYLSRDRINDYLDHESIDFTDKVNVTYFQYEIRFINELITRFLYNIYFDIEEYSYEKIKEYDKEKTEFYRNN